MIYHYDNNYVNQSEFNTTPNQCLVDFYYSFGQFIMLLVFGQVNLNKKAERFIIMIIIKLIKVNLAQLKLIIGVRFPFCGSDIIVILNGDAKWSW